MSRRRASKAPLSFYQIGKYVGGLLLFILAFSSANYLQTEYFYRKQKPEVQYVEVPDPNPPSPIIIRNPGSTASPMYAHTIAPSESEVNSSIPIASEDYRDNPVNFSNPKNFLQKSGEASFPPNLAFVPSLASLPEEYEAETKHNKPRNSNRNFVSYFQSSGATASSTSSDSDDNSSDSGSSSGSTDTSTTTPTTSLIWDTDNWDAGLWGT